MQLITDKYNRQFKTLRVSLLSRCNLSCAYCTMGEDEVKENNLHQSIVPAGELLNTINKLHAVLNLETIRLTGGEPLLYPHLIELIKEINTIGIPEIKLTTNGLLLERMAKPMKDAGMQSINVSLDAMDEDVFFLISKRNHLQKILNGIDAALEAGLKVKINSVIMKGVNDSQVLPLLQYAFDRNITIRFLEVMAMGHLHHDPLKYLFTQEDILSLVGTKYNFNKITRMGSATSNYWQTTDGNVFGIIANESEPFCHDCNRLRLDSDGNIYGCLSSNHPISLKNIDDPLLLNEKLQEAMLQKQAVKFTGSDLSMLHIGG
jgi:GTP 3',8-cyclase